jgi:hypothetical protein
MDKGLTLEIGTESNQAEAFVLCLALGTLRAIKDGLLDPNSGTWTLGRPVFWKTLELGGVVSENVLHVLKSADEFGTIRTLSGEGSFQEALSHSLAVIEHRLQELGGESWYAVISHKKIG